VVFAAGSLIIPFADLEQAFEEKYPYIDVLAEYHGSIQVMRHVTELHEPIDVVATADAALVPMLMYTSTVPETGQPYANWYIRFASNRLALAYTPESKYADEINADNWPEILARPDVKLGLADPRFDASGYRTLMAFSLMENALGRYDLFGPMFDRQFSFPVTIFRDDDLTTITVPEILETKQDSHIVLRGGSIMLIALLESGDLDYAFEYESVIRQHGLEMLSLPETVNMGEAAFESAYEAVQVDLDFRRFVTVEPQFRGERIGYGITIPSNAPHPQEAALFIAFLLGPEGRAIMEADYHPLLDPCLADGYENMPESLQSLCIPADAP
jgi:molybdate/tungstate transport system substrate-binding protein